ncbi:hypothetical protein GCM10010361_52450 [Streptomyces olivaceiscleroticus]|uniref:Transposase n=1 Tax=Streptomyces olivaceiscleroticus TaxID=68245 RepID=A0ABN1APC2_9ACTN
MEKHCRDSELGGGTGAVGLVVDGNSHHNSVADRGAALPTTPMPRSRCLAHIFPLLRTGNGQRATGNEWIEWMEFRISGLWTMWAILAAGRAPPLAL